MLLATLKAAGVPSPVAAVTCKPEPDPAAPPGCEWASPNSTSRNGARFHALCIEFPSCLLIENWSFKPSTELSVQECE
jgi:hypothetical protein